MNVLFWELCLRSVETSEARFPKKRETLNMAKSRNILIGSLSSVHIPYLAILMIPRRFKSYSSGA